jgi:hypothetical protein
MTYLKKQTAVKLADGLPEVAKIGSDGRPNHPLIHN